VVTIKDKRLHKDGRSGAVHGPFCEEARRILREPACYWGIGRHSHLPRLLALTQGHKIAVELPAASQASSEMVTRCTRRRLAAGVVREPGWHAEGVVNPGTHYRLVGRLNHRAPILDEAYSIPRWRPKLSVDIGMLLPGQRGAGYRRSHNESKIDGDPQKVKLRPPRNMRGVCISRRLRRSAVTSVRQGKPERPGMLCRT
jgi:hypothetical protein